MREELADRSSLWENVNFHCDVLRCEGDAIFYAVQDGLIRSQGCAQHSAPVILLAARDQELYLRELMGDQFEYLRVPPEVLAQWTRAASRFTGDN